MSSWTAPLFNKGLTNGTTKNTVYKVDSFTSRKETRFKQEHKLAKTICFC